MEDIVVKYRNQNVKARQGKDSVLAILPVDEDRPNKFTVFEALGKGWRITETDMKTKEFMTVVLDNNMNYSFESTDMPNHIQNPIKKLDLKYGTLYRQEDLARDLYDFKNRFLIKQKTGLDAEQVIRIRQMQVVTYLKLLGYKSLSDTDQEPDINSSYFSLRKIADDLENYKDLSFIGINIHDSEIMDFDMPEDIDPDKISTYIMEVANDVQSNIDKINEEDERIELIRGIDSEYYTDIKSKMSDEEYSTYSSQVKAVAKLLLELNYDILPDNLKKKYRDLSSLSRIEKGDKISRVIDSENFQKACNIEDFYIAKENEKFAEGIDASIEGVDENNTVIKTLVGIRDGALAISKERRSHINYYNEKLSKMYKAMQNAKYARFNLEHEER